MTRQEITSTYDVDSHGVIRSPGQFEGEALYVPYFWQAYLEGFADEDRAGILTFYIMPEDREIFPELGKSRRKVKLYQRGDGFVCEV